VCARACARCSQLKAVKRACIACRRSKVKCDLDDRHPSPCTRCAHLGYECQPHVPAAAAAGSRKRGAAEALGGMDGVPPYAAAALTGASYGSPPARSALDDAAACMLEVTTRVVPPPLPPVRATLDEATPTAADDGPGSVSCVG